VDPLVHKVCIRLYLFGKLLELFADQPHQIFVLITFQLSHHFKELLLALHECLLLSLLVYLILKTVNLLLVYILDLLHFLHDFREFPLQLFILGTEHIEFLLLDHLMLLRLVLSLIQTQLSTLFYNHTRCLEYIKLNNSLKLPLDFQGLRFS